MHKSGGPKISNLEIKSIVKKDNLLNLISSRKIFKYNFYDRDHPRRQTKEIIKTAYDKIGQTEYSLGTDNCQQFCFLCRNGINKSPEVNYNLIIKKFNLLIQNYKRLVKRLISVKMLLI